MKTVKVLRKRSSAILACALPLAVNAQMKEMAHDTMMTNSTPTGGMMPAGMHEADSSKMGNTMPGTMTHSPQMGNMAPAMNGAKMDPMASAMMNAAAPLQVGSIAPDFTLKTLDDRSVRLNDLTAKSEVVLVVLRGWPGYQCPFCSRQARDFVRNDEKFKAAGAHVLMVYPGPADDLKAHAAEFLHDQNWPKDYLLLLDQDYAFTKAYGLRWDAPKETAYPSTFIIGKDGKVAFARVSKKHGDRVDAETVLKALHPAMHMM